MRLNKWLASHTHYSRRKADELIAAGRVTVNGKTAALGTTAEDTDQVTIDQKRVQVGFSTKTSVVMLHKPIGYVCSRNGQGAPTVYSLIPVQYHHLDIVGRLDKDSSGLVLFTNDGELHQKLTHPRFAKEKVYEVTVNTPITEADQVAIQKGVQLDDGPSALKLKQLSNDGLKWQVRMHEGRNRQIRRTFAAVSKNVTKLVRLQIGDYTLSSLKEGKWLLIHPTKN